MLKLKGFSRGELKESTTFSVFHAVRDYCYLICFTWGKKLLRNGVIMVLKIINKFIQNFIIYSFLMISLQETILGCCSDLDAILCDWCMEWIVKMMWFLFLYLRVVLPAQIFCYSAVKSIEGIFFMVSIVDFVLNFIFSSKNKALNKWIL